eukprot:Platyproteum_vivax@DN4707_c0_g1_i1.p1
MFVVINSYSLAYMVDQPKDRCAVCLRDCGLSITMTTITNLLSFAIGALSPYVSIRNFCIFTGVSLLAGYIFALSFFFAVLCIDAQREAANKVCLSLKPVGLRCRKRKKITDDGDSETCDIAGHQVKAAPAVSTFSLVSFKAKAVVERSRLRYTKKEAPAPSQDVPGSLASVVSPTQRMELGHTDSHPQSQQSNDSVEEFWEEPRGTVGRRWRIFFLHHYGQWITYPIVKVCILLVFAAYVGVSIYGFTFLPQGLELRQLAPDDSYLQSFEDDLGHYFNKYGPPTDVMLPVQINWWDDNVRQDLTAMKKTISGAYYTHSYLSVMEFFDQSEYAPDLSTATNKKLSFLNSFREFLADDKYKRFQKDTSWDETGAELRAWRFLVLPKYYPKSQERGQFMVDMRADVASKPSLHGRAYNYYFVFFESDLQIFSSVVKNLSLAAVCMLAVALILIPKVSSALLVILTIAMIDVGLFGFMSFWGLQLNMITMINLVISIGFSVDYSAHICHTFTHCEGETRNLRATEALVLMGGPILHGAMSTQMGVIMLAFSSSFVFRVFFKMMTMVLVFGVSHGVIFLPVMLSLVGPMPRHKKDDSVLANKEADTPLSTDQASTQKVPSLLDSHVPMGHIKSSDFSVSDVDSPIRNRVVSPRNTKNASQ